MELSGNTGSISVRVNTKNIPALIRNIEAKWISMAPSQPFSYTFLDADFNNVYKAEQRTGKLFMIFSVFAIFIGCLGLFGLVSYAAEQRTKEIGIRKVLGAKVTGIVTMLSRDFAKLVLIAALIAYPLAWWAMDQWLQSFAYRISISLWVFALAGIIAIVIALITVSFQAIKAAIANPVKSLRSE
jgi:putative ABC transport system permease protein